MSDYEDYFDDLSDAGCGGCILYLLGIVIIIYITYVVICCAILITVVAIAMIATIGLLWGICRSTYNFCLALKGNLFTRSGQIEKNSYVNFFDFSGDGFRNLAWTCKETYERNIQDLFRRRRKPNGFVETVAQVVFTSFHFIAVLLATIAYLPVLVILCSILYISIWAMYVSLTFEMRVLEWVIIKIHGLFNICHRCHRRIDLPVYRCPRCGTEYANLIPSVKFGPFFRKCRCGEYLPTSRFFGRNELPSFCPNPICRHSLQSQDIVPVSIAVVGGPSVGKSHFMMDALYLLKYEILPKMHRSCSIPDEDKPVVDNLLRLYSMGISPQSTRDSMIEPICLEMKASSWAFPRRLYLYDPPGESFRDSKKISLHRYYQNMKGAVFIIDPFTLDEVLSDYQKHGITHTMMQTGAMKPEESLERWLISMERDFCGVTKHSYLAVCINKTDEPSFTRITGLKTGSSGDDCLRFLKKYNCENLINTFKSNFKCVEFFSVSAIGAVKTSNAFKPEGISDALVWLMKNIKV